MRTRAKTLSTGAAAVEAALETPEDVRLMALDAIDASVSVNETAPFMVEAARFGIDQARNA